MVSKRCLTTILVFFNLVTNCFCIEKVVQHRCDEDPTSTTNVLVSLKILPNDDVIDSVYAFQASGSVLEVTDRIAACTQDASGVADPLTDTIDFAITIDTTATVHDCGAELSTQVIGTDTVTFIDFKFHIYSAGDIYVTSADDTRVFTCRTDDLNVAYVQTNQLDITPKPPVVVPHPQHGAFLRLRDAVNKNPLVTTTVGDTVILSTEFIPGLERGSDNCGSLFYIGYLGNDAIGVTPDPNLYIKIVPKQAVRTDVTITAGGSEVKLKSDAGEVLTHAFDPDFMGCSDGAIIEKAAKGIEINAFDHEVCVLVVSREANTEEFYTALPVDVTGDEYIIVTGSDATSDAAELMIVASEDATTANLHIPVGASDMTYDTTTYSGGDTLTLTLDKLETLHLSQATDLSRYRVTSDKQVSVIAGNQNFDGNHLVKQLPPATDLSRYRVTSDKPVSVIAGSQNYDGNHLVEQLPPLERVGQRYAFPFLKPSIDANAGWVTRYRLQATVAGTTTVTQYTGAATFTTFDLTYGAAPVDVDVTEATQCEIEADNAILVGMVILPPAASTQFRPAMAVVPSMFQWASRYNVSGPGDNFMAFFVVHKNPVSAFGRANAAVSNFAHATETAILGPNGYTLDSAIILPDDMWTFYSRDDPSHFMVYAVAFDLIGGTQKSALYLPIGLRYSINNLCIRVGRAGDLTDNDCDGLIDEEDINGVDDDGDGTVDEDPGSYNKQYAGVVAIRPINCRVSADVGFPATALTNQLTDSDGCPVSIGNSPFGLASGWAVKAPENDEEIGGAEEVKVLYTGELTVAMYFGYSKLYFICDTINCFSAADTACTTDICASTARRKRQADLGNNDNNTISTEVLVHTYRRDGADVRNVTTLLEPTIQACLEHSAIQAAGGLLLGVSLLAIVTACCFCFMFSKRWRTSRRRRHKRYPSTNSKLSTVWTSHSRRY